MLGRSKHFYATRGLGSRPPMICYVGATPEHTRVTFTREEESDLLHDFYISAGSVKLGWEASCAVSDRVTENLATKGGLRLGLTRADVVARLGTTRSRTDTGGFLYDSSRLLTDLELEKACGKNPNCSKDTFAFYGEIELTFRNGRVVAFEVYRGITT